MTGRGQCDVDWLGEQLTAAADSEDASEGALINGQVLLVDCRSATDFGTLHITGAVSLALPNLIQRRLLKGNLATPAALGYCSANEHGVKVTEEQWKTNTIVLYDDSATSSQLTRASSEDVACTSTKIVAVLLDHLLKDGYNACLLQGGLKNFKAKYPHFCVDEEGDLDNTLQIGIRNLRLSSPTAEQKSEEAREPSKETNSPVEVLPQLFLGDAKNASDLEFLQEKGIRYILNVTPNVPNAFEMSDKFTYLQIPINDHWTQNLTKYFPQAINFIDEGRRLNYGVLVHCLAGISRSVTVTVAYLMYSMSLSLNDAYDYVKRRKPNVSPNLTFMGQLLDFENALKVDRRLCLCSCHTNSDSSFSSSSTSSSSPSSSSSCLSTSCYLSAPVKASPESAVDSENCCSSCSRSKNITKMSFSSSSSATTTTVSSPSYESRHNSIYSQK